MTMDSSCRKSWTLGRMFFQLDGDVERYVLSHSVGYGASGAALVDETAGLGDPAVMMLGKEQYPLFRFLAGMLGCKHALDVGTFTGLSALAFAEGMGPAGRVVTIDRDAEWVAIAKRHWASAGVDDRIEARIGEAGEILRDLAAEDARFDMAFLDVEKARVGAYFEATLRLLTSDGLIMVDNTFWHGWVLDRNRDDQDTAGMRNFNDRIANDERFEVVVLPIADGLTLVRRRG